MTTYSSRKITQRTAFTFLTLATVITVDAGVIYYHLYHRQGWRGFKLGLY